MPGRAPSPQAPLCQLSRFRHRLLRSCFFPPLKIGSAEIPASMLMFRRVPCPTIRGSPKFSPFRLSPPFCPLSSLRSDSPGRLSSQRPGSPKKHPRKRSPGCSARIPDFRGWPSSINQSPVRFVSRSTMRESCPEEVKGGKSGDSQRVWRQKLQGFLASPALALDSFLSFWGGASGNQPSFLNFCPPGPGLK